MAEMLKESDKWRHESFAKDERPKDVMIESSWSFSAQNSNAHLRTNLACGSNPSERREQRGLSLSVTGLICITSE